MAKKYTDDEWAAFFERATAPLKRRGGKLHVTDEGLRRAAERLKQRPEALRHFLSWTTGLEVTLPEDCGEGMDKFLDELIAIWHQSRAEK